MYARMSRGKVRSGHHESVKAYVAELENKTRDVPGLLSWTSLLSDAGELSVVAVYENKEACLNTANLNATRWTDAQHLFEGAPVVEYGEVLAVVAR